MFDECFTNAAVCRMAELDAKAAALTRATALAKSAVQPEQLASSVAQLSTAASRRDHERVQQLAGLGARLEKLEGHIATRDQVVTQVSGETGGCACVTDLHLRS